MDGYLIPPWEHRNANINIDYSVTKKDDSTNLLVTEVREYIKTNYLNHLKIYTDGSVLDSLDSASAFIIPALNVRRSYYLEKGYYIYA